MNTYRNRLAGVLAALAAVIITIAQPAAADQFYGSGFDNQSYRDTTLRVIQDVDLAWSNKRFVPYPYSSSGASGYYTATAVTFGGKITASRRHRNGTTYPAAQLCLTNDYIVESKTAHWEFRFAKDGAASYSYSNSQKTFRATKCVKNTWSVTLDYGRNTLYYGQNGSAIRRITMHGVLQVKDAKGNVVQSLGMTSQDQPDKHNE